MDPKGIAIVITKKKPSKPSGYMESASDDSGDDAGEMEGDDTEEGIDISEEFQAASDEALTAAKKGDAKGYAKALKSAIMLCEED